MENPGSNSSVLRRQSEEMKNLRYISYISLCLSGYGIFRLLIHRVRNEDSPLFHQTLFRAHTYLLYVSFFSSILLLLISCKIRGKRHIDLLTSFVMWILLNSGIYAVALALCLLLDIGTVGRALVLLSAAVPGGLALLVSLCQDPKVFDEFQQPCHAWVNLHPEEKV